MAAPNLPSEARAHEAQTDKVNPSLTHRLFLICATLLAIAAVLTTRPEFAAVSALLLFDVLRTNPTVVRVRRARPISREGAIRSQLEISGEGGLPDGIHVRVAGISGKYLSLVVAPQRVKRPQSDSHTSPGAEWQRTLDLSDWCRNTGQVDLLSAQIHTLMPLGAMEAIELPALIMEVPAPRTAISALPTPQRLVGAWGPREDRRAGSGTRFFDVALHRPGDRLSHISWKATARAATGEDIRELYVARAHAGAESLVFLAIDPRDAVGANVDAWAGANQRSPGEITSLDIARNAVMSLADAHLQAGDRVGLIDIANPGQGAPPATGRRARERLDAYVTTVRAPHRAPIQVRPPRIPPAASVWMISTFLDPIPSTLAMEWAHSGHQVYAVDILPRNLHSRDAALRLALDLELAERDARLINLRNSGITVIRWPDLEEPDESALFALARARRRR